MSWGLLACCTPCFLTVAGLAAAAQIRGVAISRTRSVQDCGLDTGTGPKKLWLLKEGKERHGSKRKATNDPHQNEPTHGVINQPARTTAGKSNCRAASIPQIMRFYDSKYRVPYIPLDVYPDDGNTAWPDLPNLGIPDISGFGDEGAMTTVKRESQNLESIGQLVVEQWVPRQRNMEVEDETG
ncbi:hypothetical protein C8F04DRAFT_1176412 [Mycena alexandri]|uniref:Uncharacterized protein n=1 Tax=Mycena alexandri TaxID=1745969 RepID=A0AAD6T9I7_9AGAR|nr:hypothetical protein C8F04DRAFT_1176412 [Mycena alexandri]